jgi:hypothetical protein
VNIQTVVVDTQRGIEEVQGKINKLLLEDADHRALVRYLSDILAIKLNLRE